MGDGLWRVVKTLQGRREIPEDLMHFDAASDVPVKAVALLRAARSV